MKVNAHSGKVNTDSGKSAKSVHVESRMDVHIRPEQVFTLRQNQCSAWGGICNQINKQDPHSGLTAAHIAIFRQNRVLVAKLAENKETDWKLKDVFNRRPVDMLDYTVDEEIFQVVIYATYQNSVRELESFSDEDELSDPTSRVVTFKPKPIQ